MTDDVSPSMPHSPDPAHPSRTGPVQYKGADLEAGRGPGLGCFRFQLVVLAILLVLTPYSVAAGWGDQVSAALLFATLALLLITGQTIIFLLRIVAAERRGRRRPLAARSPTVGEIEDAERRRGPQDGAIESAPEDGPARSASDPANGSTNGDGMRQ